MRRFTVLHAPEEFVGHPVVNVFYDDSFVEWVSEQEEKYDADFTCSEGERVVFRERAKS